MYDNVWEKAKVPYKLIVILSDSFPLFGGPFRDSKNCHIKRLSYLPYLHISTWIHSSTLYFQHKDLLSVFAVPCTCLYAECVCVQMADAAKLESLACCYRVMEGGKRGGCPCWKMAYNIFGWWSVLRYATYYLWVKPRGKDAFCICSRRYSE